MHGSAEGWDADAVMLCGKLLNGSHQHLQHVSGSMCKQVRSSNTTYRIKSVGCSRARVDTVGTWQPHGMLSIMFVQGVACATQICHLQVVVLTMLSLELVVVAADKGSQKGHVVAVAVTLWTKPTQQDGTSTICSSTSLPCSMPSGHTHIAHARSCTLALFIQPGTLFKKLVGGMLDAGCIYQLTKPRGIVEGSQHRHCTNNYKLLHTTWLLLSRPSGQSPYISKPMLLQSPALCSSRPRLLLLC